MKTPVALYIIHHPDCEPARDLAKSLYDWFRLGYLSGDQSGAGLPVYYRRELDSDGRLLPEIELDDADSNIVVVLVDYRMVVDENWRAAVVRLAQTISRMREPAAGDTSATLLPAAMHDSFYRTGPLYEHFNPVRLLDMNAADMTTSLRRSVTESTARILRSKEGIAPPPLNVFLSHAKADGRPIAEGIRDAVRKFGQLTAWYDANDLPYGVPWESPMTQAASDGTAAMIATVTDAYSTRPWCRAEAKMARMPRVANQSGDQRIWRVQPVIAVHAPGDAWSSTVPCLSGVPGIGWKADYSTQMTEQITDRLVLEVLLSIVHEKVATELQETDEDRERSLYLTWVPDEWTLTQIRFQLDTGATTFKSRSIRRIVYPGHNLSSADKDDLRAVLSFFHPDTKLVSFEEAMP